MFFHKLMSYSTLQGEKRIEEHNWSTLEKGGIALCSNAIHLPNANDIVLCPNEIDRLDANDIAFSPNAINRPDANDQSLSSGEHLHDPVSGYHLHLESTDFPSHPTIPTDQSPKNIYEVNIPLTILDLVDNFVRYHLPFRQNHGSPLNRYSLDDIKTSKYPIANFVSTQRLSEPFKGLVHK